MRRYGQKLTDALIQPAARDGAWARGDALGHAVALTWTVGDVRGAERPVDGPSLRAAGGYQKPDATELRLFRKAVRELEKVSGIEMVEVDGPADMTFHVYQRGPLLGWANNFRADREGGVAMRALETLPGPKRWTEIALHELGHAVGLDHPFENTRLPRKLDNTRHTLMSYDEAGPTKAKFRGLDVATLQRLYGADEDLTVRARRDGGVDVFGGDGRDAMALSFARRTGPDGQGPDALYGGGGADRLIAGARADGALYGGAGRDRLEASFTRDRGRDGLSAEGGAGDDLFDIDRAGARLMGGSGDDEARLTARSAGAQFHGEGGDDVLVTGGRLQDVAFYGGAGDDAAKLKTASGQRLFGGGGDDRLTGAGRSDGGRGDDRLIGGVGRDRLKGGAGRDDLVGLEGVDRLFGGRGADRLAAEGDGDKLYGDAGRDQLFGGDLGDRTPERGDSRAALFGGAGDDALFGGATARGGDGDDAVTAEVAYGGAGNDRIDAADMGGRAWGGTGADEIVFLAGARVQAGGGDDEVRQSPDAKASRGEAFVRGQGGDDKLILGAGRDSVSGGAGDDVIRGGDDLDRLFGGGGADALFGEDGHDRIRGGAGNDELFGGADGDDLRGERGADRVFGGDSFDRLFGGDGDDFLRGGQGLDLYYGGEGADVFVLERAGGGPDRVEDYDPDLDRIGAPDFAALDELSIFEADGDVVVATLADGPLLRLEGFALAEFDAATAILFGEDALA